MEQNSHFIKQIATLHRALPKSSKILLILVYTVAGLAISAFSYHHMKIVFAPAVAFLVAVGIGLGSQGVRGLGVFLPLINPAKPPLTANFPYAVAVIAAFVCGFEVFEQADSVGFPFAMQITFVVFVFFGLVIECLIIHKIHEALLINFFSKPENVDALMYTTHSIENYKTLRQQILEGTYQQPAPTLHPDVEFQLENENLHKELAQLKSKLAELDMLRKKEASAEGLDVPLEVPVLNGHH